MSFLTPLVNLFRRPPPVDTGAIVKETAAEVLRAVQPLIPTVETSKPRGIYAFDHPYWYTTPQAPQRRPGSLVTLDTLRHMAAVCVGLRAVLQHLKREVAAVPLQIAPRDDGDDSAGTKKRIEQAQAFFDTPGGLGGLGRRRSQFEAEVIEDLCVIGAAAVYYRAICGGRPYEVVAIDAATIRPRVDAYGWAPDGDAYEQWIHGIPVESYTPTELFYDGLYPLSWSPYFASPVEWLINTINAALRADQWNLTWLTDGSQPGDIISLPDQWTPDQVVDFALAWDSLLAGNSKARQKTLFVPGGTQRVTNQSRKDQDFQEYELWLLRLICAIFSVQLASLGFTGEQYKVSQDESMGSTSAFGVGVLLAWLKALYDDLLQRLGFDDLEARHVTAREEDASERATRNQVLVGAGIKTINEARGDEGLDALPDGDTLLVSNTMVTFDSVVNPPAPVVAPSLAPGAPGQNGNGQPPPPANGKPPAAGGGQQAAKPDRTAQRQALASWERVCQQRLRDGRPARNQYRSPLIPDDLHQRIVRSLGSCGTPAAVAAVFAAQEITDE